MVGTLRSEQYYLVNKNEKQYFALVTDAYALARAMPVALKSKKIRVGDKERIQVAKLRTPLRNQ